VGLRRHTPHVPRSGGLDETFFFVADTHFGYRDGDYTNTPLLKRLVTTLNDLPGTSRPPLLGEGAVAEPHSVIVAGDLTEDGTADEWAMFRDHFGLGRDDAMLRHRVYESVGNHDYHAGDIVAGHVAVRHGHIRYAVDVGDLRVLCLGDGPDVGGLEWLRETLAETGTERPILVYLHYPIIGPYSDTSSFGKSLRRWQMLHALRGFNVIGIFHGHFHASGAYRFLGFDVYNVGAAKHGSNSFAVVRVTDDEMTVGSYNWQHQTWWWAHRKSINGGAPALEMAGTSTFGGGPHETLEVYSIPDQRRRALFPYPPHGRG